jgi:hypothetical protein
MSFPGKSGKLLGKVCGFFPISKKEGYQNGREREDGGKIKGLSPGI